MNHQPQPPYYHSTLEHNYCQSSNKAPKHDDQYFVDVSQPPPRIIQPQRTLYILNQPATQQQNTHTAPQNLSNISSIRPQNNSSGIEEVNSITTQNSNAAQADLQNATLQLAETESEMLNSPAQNQMQL